MLQTPQKTEIKAKIGILLILFNRVNLAKKRLEELVLFSSLAEEVFISVDADKDSSSSNRNYFEVVRLVQEFTQSNSVNVFMETNNQGCDKHIPRAISRTLDICDAVFVIEDDVRMSVSALEKAIGKMREIDFNNEMQPVISMSALTRRVWSKENYWRETPYFSPWGFGINKNFWKAHLELEKSRRGKLVLDTLVHSYFRRLSPRRQLIWNERSFRGNYDYSIQATMFELNIYSAAPSLRIADNEGFGSSESTHTRFKRPWYLKKKAEEVPETSLMKEIGYVRIIRLFSYMDSVTWAGDSLFSPRGRLVGFRSSIRNVKSGLNKYARN